MSVLLNKDYNKGFNDGIKHGAKMAKKAVAIEFLERLQALKDKKGIGPKTWDKILECLEVKDEGPNNRSKS